MASQTETDALAARLTAALASAAAEVETALDELLPLEEGAEGRLCAAMRYATLGGGKRMRAFLVMETATLFGVDRDCAARVAASVEMLHAYSLIHDDLPAMDDDDLRRGKPSTHKQFDEATAILAGDALQARAFEILGELATHSSPDARCELVVALGHSVGARGMCGGQMIDILAEGHMGAILAPPFRSPTMCWTRPAPRRRSAKRLARMPPPARRPWSRCWGWNAPRPRRMHWRPRQPRIWIVLATVPYCSGNLRRWWLRDESSPCDERADCAFDPPRDPIAGPCPHSSGFAEFLAGAIETACR